MALNAYQLISRVLPGRPFGDGRDGALTISSNTTQSQTVKSCNGTSGTNTLNLASSGFSNGDIVLIIQMRGTNGGVYEVNIITSGGGTSTLTLGQNLQTTYGNSGSNSAQVIKIPMYTTVTVNGGVTWSAPEWDGSTGGILLYAANVSASIAGTISGNSKGFVGGSGSGPGAMTNGYCGEGSAGASYRTSGANGNGGGGGPCGASGDAGGAGGGHASSGGNGTGVGSSGGGTGGSAVGAADLSTMFMGGGGGGGQSDDTTTGPGGDGGGITFMAAKSITITGSITHTGGNGASSGQGASGGGAGGACLIMAQTATLGTNLITVAGGSGGSCGGTTGGNGSVGRIAVHYSANVTGSTSPSFTQTFDGRLLEQLGGILFFV